MVALLASAVLQFCDGNGAPYAGGSLGMYIPGTTTPKATWSESTGTVLNTQPIVLDSAGRCICFGDGAYRMVLLDALGNTIFDQTTSTSVSSAMGPVALAPDIATALSLLGIPALMNVEATARISADNTEQNRAQVAEATLTTSVGALQTASTATNAAVAAEVTRATAAEAAIVLNAGFPAGKRLQFGSATTAGTGLLTVTFPIAFSATPIVTITAINSPSGCTLAAYAITTNSFIAYTSKSFTTGDGLGPVDFAWIAIGNI